MGTQDPRTHLLEKLAKVNVCMLTTAEQDGTLVTRPMGLQQAEDVDPTWVSLRVDQVPTSETIEIDGIAWDLHADPTKPERRLVAEVDGSTVVLTTTGDQAVLEDLAHGVAKETR